MAKFLVCSDIHGEEERLEFAFYRKKDIQTVIVCGDLEFETYDIEEIIRRNTSRSIDIRMVRGNCDAFFSSSASVPDFISFDLTPTHRVFVTHGHLFRASYQLMAEAARQNNCDTVIFGHTHRQVDTIEHGVRFLNPGAIKSGNYMLIETREDGEFDVTFR